MFFDHDDERWEDNIPGKYYVTYDCIACEACVMEAPRFFQMNLGQGHAYCSQQPSKEQEIVNAEDALLYCPVNAIKSSGDDR